MTTKDLFGNISLTKGERNMNNNIAKFRKPLGLSQHRLAKLVGLKRHSIMAYENQTKIPTVKIAYEISKVLKKDITEVFIFE